MTAAKSGFTANWIAQTEMMPDRYISGYQIQYSLKSNMSSAKTTKVSGYDKTSSSIKKLKRRKTYYVRIRTYVTDSNGTCYSAWSETKKIKTK